MSNYERYDADPCDGAVDPPSTTPPKPKASFFGNEREERAWVAFAAAVLTADKALCTKEAAELADEMLGQYRKRWGG